MKKQPKVLRGHGVKLESFKDKVKIKECGGLQAIKMWSELYSMVAPNPSYKSRP